LSKLTRRIIAAEIARKVADELEEEAKRDARRNAEMLRGAELLRDVAQGGADAVAELREESEVKIPVSDEGAPEGAGEPAGAGVGQGDAPGADAGAAGAADRAAASATSPAEPGPGVATTAAAVSALTEMAVSDAADPVAVGAAAPGSAPSETAVEAVEARLEPPASQDQPEHVMSVTAVQSAENGVVEVVSKPARKNMPVPIESRLSTTAVRVPQEVSKCSGIMVNGHRIKSFAYSTDVAVIHNTNADAILAVYPFTGHPQIMKAIQSVAKAPVFTGVGGGTTTGQRVLELAMFAEMQGMMGVVLNAPAPVETVERVATTVDIPVMATVLQWDDFARAKVEAGASIINVAAGRDTADVVRQIREEYPSLPVVATGGTKPESILRTIEAGANAISWTPPSAPELQGMMMDQYREGYAAGEQIGHAHAEGLEAGRLSSWLADKGL
jgi:CheY-like chemotaxis protein